MSLARDVVFDCNIFVQTIINSSGPSGSVFQSVRKRLVRLHISEVVLYEVRDVCSRQELARKFRLSSAIVDAFIDQVRENAVCWQDVPHVFDYERDPKDEHYVDLAVAAKATLIVSRDKDLLDLADLSKPDGKSFHEQFPRLEIVTPVELVKRLETTELAKRKQHMLDDDGGLGL